MNIQPIRQELLKVSFDRTANLKLMSFTVVPVDEGCDVKVVSVTPFDFSSPSVVRSLFLRITKPQLGSTYEVRCMVEDFLVVSARWQNNKTKFDTILHSIPSLFDIGFSNISGILESIASSDELIGGELNTSDGIEYDYYDHVWGSAVAGW